MSGFIGGNTLKGDDGSLIVTSTAYAHSAEGTRFVGKLYSCGVGTSTKDLRVDKAIRLQGAYYWVRNPSLGDFLSFSVMDIDNVLGNGANVQIAEYVKTMPIAPWQHHLELIAPTAAEIAPGLYLRLSYFNSGSTAVDMGVTYRWFQARD